MNRLVVIASAAAALAACSSTPLPTDKIKDAREAIRLGQDACGPEDEVYLKGDWHAELHDGKWRVWFWVPGSHYGPTYETFVRASDGAADSCTFRIETD